MKIPFLSGKRKPNIVMILIDCGGREDAITKVPFYQKLKESSVLFSSFITYAPYTIGALNAMFSGMYGNLNGVQGYYKSYSFDKDHVFTLTQYLKDEGYYTEMDFPIEDVLPQQGFDKVRLFGKDETKEIDLLQRHCEVLNQIKDKQPFFLFLEYNKLGLTLMREVIKKYDDYNEDYFRNKEKNFSRYLKELEESGNYLEGYFTKMKELDLFENSIIVVFADHGSSVGDKPGEKVYGTYLYDYTIKCWAYVIGNGIPKNLEIRQVVRNIDLLPTILELLKISVKKKYKPIQGRSLLPLLTGKKEARIAYSETGGLGGPTPSPEKHNIRAVRTDKWKLIYNETNKKKELYDLENDREEINNLIGKGLDIEKLLWDELQRQGELL